MPTDRVVTFHHRAPNKSALKTILTDYFGEIASVYWDANINRFMCVPAGKLSPALRQMSNAGASYADRFALGSRRWIEVYQNPRSLYIMTRSMDEATEALAEGLAKLFVEFYQGDRVQ